MADWIHECFLISNPNQFFHHLGESFHILKEGDSVQTLLKKAACFNKENGPKMKTCFLRPIENPLHVQGKVFSPIEKEELLMLITETIRSGNKQLNNKGRVEAIHRFDRSVGVHCTFKNGVNDNDGFQITELYTVMVVYDYGSDNSIIGITAFPLLE